VEHFPKSHLDKLIVTQIVKKFPAFYGTRRFVTVPVHIFPTLVPQDPLQYYPLMGQFSGIALSYGRDGRGFESRQGLGIFLFTTASRPALGPTQPPIQWVQGPLSLGVKRPGREADHSPPCGTEVKECVEQYSTPPICLHGAVLS
jgi:hypothetical protein